MLPIPTAAPYHVGMCRSLLSRDGYETQNRLAVATHQKKSRPEDESQARCREHADTGLHAQNPIG